MPSNESRRRFIDEGDSAYVYQRRYRILGALTTSDRYIVNKIAANQAELEVTMPWRMRWRTWDAPMRLGAQADHARAPADTLLGDVRALALAQTNRSMVRAGELQREA